MKRLPIFLSVILISILAFSVFSPETAYSASSNETIRIMLAYQPGQKAAVMNALLRAGAQMHYDFDDLNTFALTLPLAALDGIRRNPHVVYVEEDPLRYLTTTVNPITRIERAITQAGNPYAEQVVPYGIDMVQARDVWDANRDGLIDSGAFTGARIKVCIIDSGLYTAHEDFSGVNVTGGYPTGWNSDGLGHGTHVAGTITAMNNNVGVVGVTPGTVDLYIVRVFGDDGSWIYASTLIDAANRCSSAGADIISMSLSGPRANNIERRGFDNLYSAGILSIAAASNEGTSDYHYPASYDSVISVGALDETMTWADFSNFNDQVELVAPGVDVLSTIPYIETNSLVVDGVTYAPFHIEYSAYGTATGNLVNGGLCGTAGAWTGKVVLCQRGDYDFSVKVNSVEAGGGVAAVIYNNEPGNFLGTMGEGNSSSIIGISISQEDGQYLVSNKIGALGTVTSILNKPASGYEAWAGTSMATPHVSGVAALVWSCLPSATNVEVRNALTSTALDLGAIGRDVYYGFGLVQAKDACDNINPTAVELLSFTATGAKNSVILNWETASEIDNLGFNIYRADSLGGERLKINAELIPSNTYPGSPIGASYEYVDTGADLKQGKLLPNRTYYYWLADLDIYGESELFGPVEVVVKAK